MEIHVSREALIFFGAVLVFVSGVMLGAALDSIRRSIFGR